MDIDLQICRAEGGRATIRLVVPVAGALGVMDAVAAMLKLAGHRVRLLDADGEEFVAAGTVFPEVTPAMVLKGYRAKMEWTQKELAARLGITARRLSEMECGRRPVSEDLARRLGEIFDTRPGHFLHGGRRDRGLSPDEF